MTKKRMALYVIGALLLIVALGAAWMLGPALLPAKAIDVGIAKGAKVPVAMELRDSNGEPATLADQMGREGAVVYFVRSADWCPFCKAQVIRTEEIREKLSAKGYNIVAVSYDEPEILSRFKAEEGLGFALLSDKGSNRRGWKD